jgi:hypothetical protein
MAEPTPWQIAQAGQKLPVDPVIRTVFSRGTEPWPYQPQIVITNTGSESAVVYGVNTHQS